MKRLSITALFIIPFFLNSPAQTKKPAVKSTKTVKAVAAPASPAQTAIRGKAVYLQYCMVCHQADGSGVPNMNPPLIKTSYVLGNKTRLIQVILKGFNQSVDIDGQSYSNVMPSQSFLKDQQIADVLTYVRTNFTNKATPVTATEVKLARTK